MNASGMSLRIELFPQELDVSLAFYRDVLRFELVRDDRTGTWPYAGLRRGHVAIGLAGHSDPADLAGRRPPTGTEIVLEVDDLLAEFDWIHQRWPVEEGLTERPWGLTDFRILDPAGYYLRITHR